MSSKVVLQALDSRTFKLALKDVRFTRFNEKLTGLEPENWRFMHTPEPEETTSEYKSVLESPVEFTMVEGEVKEIKSSKEEATWTINFKKSLISLIKIQSPSGRIDISQNNVRTETGRLPEIWSVMEEGVDGECENTYQFIEVPTYMLSELTHGKMGMETCEKRGLKAPLFTSFHAHLTVSQLRQHVGGNLNELVSVFTLAINSLLHDTPDLRQTASFSSHIVLADVNSARRGLDLDEGDEGLLEVDGPGSLLFGRLDLLDFTFNHGELNRGLQDRLVLRSSLLRLRGMHEPPVFRLKAGQLLVELEFMAGGEEGLGSHGSEDEGDESKGSHDESR